jgi:tetratricopeptide (TPR) repeat protein
VKKQLILTGSALILLVSLFFFGKTIPEKSAVEPVVTQQEPAFDIKNYIRQAVKKLPASQAGYITALENSISRGDVNNQEIKVNNLLADFWKDSAKQFEPYIYYLSNAAKLESSEKNLTFAARLLKDYLRNEPEPAKRIWMADEAIALFEKAIQLDTADKTLPVDMGSCYVYGYAAAGRADKAMKGILMLKDIADKDTNNLKASLLVGVGGVISGQYDKAIARLNRVVSREPGNGEAISYLAEAYAGKGDKVEAVKWFEQSKKVINSPEYSKAVDQRIQELK